MFFFMLEDNSGYPIKERAKGYIAFDNIKAVFGLNKEKTIKKFNEV